MATIRNELILAARRDEVWAAVRDFGEVHRRLVPGFVTDCALEGDTRIVTFFNGLVAREILVSSDDSNRRLVYAIVDGRAKHYNASVEVLPEGADRARFVWIIDLLPHELAEPIGAMAEQGAEAIKRTLEGGAKN
jgi:polyketide cyclase/dehydrase/lipid transport protein